MSIDSTWLRCPNCLLDLESVADRVYGCASGHRFDRAKHGYLTLLPPRAPRTIGDDREMLTARAALLDRGAFSPIADAVAAMAAAAAVGDAEGTRRIADLGCGTGYYSARLSDSGPPAGLLLADRSPDAVRMALRAAPGSTGVVLDIWRPLPLRTGSADVILDIFAPRNPTEFARVLRPGGRLVVVVPRASHLAELREEGTLLDIPAEKAAAVADQLRPAGLDVVDSAHVTHRLVADGAMRDALRGMGPTAHHAATSTAAPEPTTGDERVVTVDVDVIGFAHSA
ncbi:putative RNA methyltransferase [Agromyces sp. SYSU T0242]|uniref:putative RNA methyltransferase n=1 Tax=Agromyces litoreus TaxID=3158561 RepID=UPI00339384DE